MPSFQHHKRDTFIELRPDSTVLAVGQLNGTVHESTEQHRLMSTHGNFGV
jgi:hypothetical protein